MPLRCPAAYARHAGEGLMLAEAAVCRGWPVPVVYAEAPGTAGELVAALIRLEAAVCRGRHDGLLLRLPGLLGDAPWLMGLLRLCTRHGVPVGVVLAHPGPGWWPGPGGSAPWGEGPVPDTRWAARVLGGSGVLACSRRGPGLVP